tara:strand:- start:4396 stop:5403 length:1008 start_codon:yes stop_codon:yes gene_type:complete
MRRTAALLLLAAAPCLPLQLPRLPRLRGPPRRLEAVVLDADGTFLDPDHRVSEANAAAVEAARSAGLRVFLATGRACSGPWVGECLTPLQLETPGVFIQGLTAFDAEGARIHDARLAPSVVTAVQEACRAQVEAGGAGITLSAYVQERLVVACDDGTNPWLERYATYGDGDIEIYGEECALDPFDLKGALRGDTPNKLLVLSDEESVPGLRAALEEALADEPARVVKALDWTLEILPTRTSKAAGLKVLLDALQISPRYVMACGDGENDLEMMRMVGLPVAMGNAKPVLVRAAGRQTASNSEDGVAKAITKYALPRAPANAPPRRGGLLRRLLRR